MRNLIFLASAMAQKPVILLQSFYESTNRTPTKDILLTNDNTGNVVDFARSKGMVIIVIDDSRFCNKNWIDMNLKKYSDFILVSCGWPFKIPMSLINTFYAAINCHGSYLPDYRGSRAYMHYWANCSDYFGATIHYLNDKFDDGNILIRGKQKLFKEESQDVIFERTAELCGHLLTSAILLVESGEIGYKPEGVKRYFYQLSPDEFKSYRIQNEKLVAMGKNPILTPHKLME